MIQLPLQTTVSPEQLEQIRHKQDSLKNATEVFIETMKEDPTTAWTNLGQSALQFGIKVLAALAIYVIGAWLIRRIKMLMNRSFERKGTDKTIASFANSCVSVSLSILVIVLAISTLGINTTSLAALLAAGGMAIGMALSGTLQNFAGGIILLAFKPFKAGDYIEAQGYEGTVSEVNICATKIVTVTNEVIVIPNGALSSDTIKNYSDKDRRRVDIKIPLEHGTDVRAAMDTLFELASADPRVLKETPGVSAPFVGVNTIDIYGVEIVVKMWSSSNDFWPLTYDFREKAYTTLTEKGFRIASPKVNITK